MIDDPTAHATSIEREVCSTNREAMTSPDGTQG